MSDKQHMQLVPSADRVASDGMLFVCHYFALIFYSLAADIAV
jgi:hypothetical protein